MKNVIKQIIGTRILGIIREDDTERAIEIANAYAEAGIVAMEMNCHYDAIKEVSKNPKISVAAGGIITSQQAYAAIKSGAKLLVSPILQMSLVKLASWYKIPLILTATTANEAYTAWKARIPLIKIYPVEELGGPVYLEDLLRPMSFLNVMPSGSITVSSIREYLERGASAVALGRDLYLNKSYDEIVAAAKCAIEQAK
jgi:2-dehydro-3-deoxyphosphogluconate aldolase/(4S)-4-hydroxy-2-oxoglutarate aldolase